MGKKKENTLLNIEEETLKSLIDSGELSTFTRRKYERRLKEIQKKKKRD